MILRVNRKVTNIFVPSTKYRDYENGLHSRDALFRLLGRDLIQVDNAYTGNNHDCSHQAQRVKSTASRL